MPVDWYHISTSHVSIGSEHFIFKRFSVARSVHCSVDGWEDAWGELKVYIKYIELFVNHFICPKRKFPFCSICFATFWNHSSHANFFSTRTHEIKKKKYSKYIRNAVILRPNIFGNISVVYSLFRFRSSNACKRINLFWSLSVARGILFVYNHNIGKQSFIFS